MRYERARELIGTARNGYDKPLQNNTRLVIRHDGYAVRLHRTDVVLIREDGTYVLNTGGWQTVTTKDRITAYSPARVYGERGTWYIDAERSDADPNPFPGIPSWDLNRADKRTYNAWYRRNRVVFYDGIVVNANGLVPPIDPAAQVKAARAWCRENGLRVRNGHVTLWKATDYAYRSTHGATYTPRTTVKARDYAPTATCGAGLHFGPTPAIARSYHGEHATILKCRVPLATLIPLIDKCKAESCYVIGRFAVIA